MRLTFFRPELPGDAVSVGDTWGPAGGHKLYALRDDDGRRCAVIRTVLSEAKGLGSGNDSSSSSMAVETTRESEALFDVELGLLRRMEEKGDTRLHMGGKTLVIKWESVHELESYRMLPAAELEPVADLAAKLDGALSLLTKVGSNEGIQALEELKQEVPDKEWAAGIEGTTALVRGQGQWDQERILRSLQEAMAAPRNTTGLHERAGIPPALLSGEKSGDAPPARPRTVQPERAAGPGPLQRDKAAEAGVRVPKEIDLGNGVSLKLLYIPPGQFEMGSGEDEIELEWPVHPHNVLITRLLHGRL